MRTSSVAFDVVIDQEVRPGGSPPHRSIEQRRDALRRANEIRVKRAEVKRTVKHRKDPAPLVEQLEDPSEHFETMKVFDLLLSLPKVGRVKANKILRQAAVSPSKTVGGLSERQRDALMSLLPHGSRRLAPARGRIS